MLELFFALFKETNGSTPVFNRFHSGCLDNPNSPPFRQFGDGSPTSSTGSPTAMEPSFSALERQSVANEWQRAAVEPLSDRDNPNFEAANDSSVVLQRLVGSEKGLLWTLERQSFAKGRPHGDVEQSVDSIKQFLPGPLTKSASSRRWSVVLRRCTSFQNFPVGTQMTKRSHNGVVICRVDICFMDQTKKTFQALLLDFSCRQISLIPFNHRQVLL